jgi:hypothetical protein
MSVNISLMIQDHATHMIAELDAEIARTTERLARLHYERMQAVAHLSLQKVFHVPQDVVE